MIGIFDSGIGGLTVAKAILDCLPEYDIIYFGDTARTPYGNKSPETVIQYVLENTRFLANEGAKIIVVACNTASSLAFGQIKVNYKVPVFEVVTPAVDLAIEKSRKKRIGVIGTRATIASGIYEKKILDKAPGAKVYSAACPLLVSLVEEGWLKKPETRMIVKKYLFPLKVREIDALILGCTHYPILKSIIQRKIGKSVKVIDSSTSVAENVKRFLDNHEKIEKSLTKNRKIKMFVSDVTDQFEKTAKALLKRNVSLEGVRNIG